MIEESPLQQFFVLYLDTVKDGTWRCAGIRNAQDEEEVLVKLFDQADSRGVSGIKQAAEIRIIGADSGLAFTPKWGPA